MGKELAALKAQPAPVQEPYAWHYKNAAGVSVWHFGPSKMFDADLEASKMWPRTHQLIPVYTENKRSISDCEELAALGWQAITCPSCGNVGARGYPRNTTPPAQPAPVAFEVGLVEWVGNKLMATPKTTTTAPASWMEMVTANLVREGVNKHKARELAEHFYGLAPASQPAVPDAFGTREGEHPQYIEGWNDCRAEMLKGMKP